ncbi:MULTISPECIES: ABC transporter permease [unclassified Bacillus (in: firmicutes)]|uniref:ABC transporter permease n=1 Tax=unclassified Bacillus (in: firmicutes) TaxID=185979 RepID=UPI0008F34EF3|nr:MULTISPECIES: ABC transporter permease [unclassified Bacillus (in: firmicutes)]SFB09608.1 ABC-2 type transport system permease protein [Bacillus sp. UNCCL13]SFQ86639.1 ABC-2 type transport system permease protein [Bacillus sp. cl95]
MKSLTIAWKDFMIRFTDRKGFLTMILMPLVLTAILGSALNSVMGGDGGFAETKVGLVLNDQDPLAVTFKEEVLPELSFIKVKKVKDDKELKDLIKDEKIDVGLSFPQGWSRDLEQGELKEVSILSLSEQPLKASVVESVLKSFSERAKMLSVTAKIVISDLTQSEAVTTGKVNMNEAATEIVQELKEAGKDGIPLMEESVGKKFVSSMQYYAAGMAVMFLLFNATVGAKSIIEERSTETLARLMITPTSHTSILIGKFLGTLLFALIQLVIFFTATTLFFDVSWGENVLQVFSIGLAYSVAVSGLSMALAAVVSDAKTTDVVSGVGVQIFAILGGSMLPIYLFPDTLQMVASVTPNKWALTSFLDIMSGTEWNELYVPIVVLLFMGLASLSIGTWRLRAN